METPETEGAPRVLIADADPQAAARAAQMLSAAGYDVAVATSGPEALHYTDSDVQDLYLLDRDLPELDGLRVARYLHRSYQVPLSRIVLLDAAAREAYMHPQI